MGFAIISREKAPVQNKRLASANLAMRSPKHKLSRRGQGPIRKKTRIRVLKVQSVNVVLLCTVPDLMLEIRPFTLLSLKFSISILLLEL
jgi:hypothetical protein